MTATTPAIEPRLSAATTPTVHAWRDPWGWTVAAAVLPIVLRTRGAPLGEPVAEDFDFLRRSVLEPGVALLDGGGSQAFWRPVSHQLYYETLGSLILDHPVVVGAIHLVLLTLAALLLYRALRPAWGGPAAAAAASFPLLAESTRTLVCWPSHFVDLGAFLFLAIAIHERTRERPWTAWPALVAALLSKELALIGALLLPFVPASPALAASRRTFWLAGTGAVIAAWALAYAWVRQQAGLELPHALERDPALLATPVPVRLAWALWHSLRATFNLSFTPSPGDFPAAVLGVSLLAGVAVALRDPALRARIAAARAWIAWGALWCVASWAALASIYPLWAPNRSQLGSVGLGIALVALLRAAHPGLILALVIGRLALFAMAPPTPAAITPEADQRGAFMDYTRLVRLQRLMRETRQALAARVPDPPRGAVLGWHNLPLSAEYAFGGSHAVQSWYRDTTLSWVGIVEFKADPALPVAAFTTYQPPPHRPVVTLEADAVRAQLAGVAALEAGDWAGAITQLDRADSLQRDRTARVFLGDNAGRRAQAWAQLREWGRAEAEARKALAAAREDVGARLVMAMVHAVRREDGMALAQLDTLLAMAPRHEDALALAQALRARMARDTTGAGRDR